MLRKRLVDWGKRAAVGATAFLVSGLAASAQCVMCSAATSGAGPKAIAALRTGIIALIIPTAAIFGGIMLIAFRHRKCGSSEPVGHLSGAEPDLQDVLGEFGPDERAAFNPEHP